MNDANLSMEVNHYASRAEEDEVLGQFLQGSENSIEEGDQLTAMVGVVVGSGTNSGPEKGAEENGDGLDIDEKDDSPISEGGWNDGCDTPLEFDPHGKHDVDNEEEEEENAANVSFVSGRRRGRRDGRTKRDAPLEFNPRGDHDVDE